MATQTRVLQVYVQTLVTNLPPFSRKLNVVFDVGALNGVFGLGVALYLQELEKQHKVEVDQVSGCSIGAVVALWYLCGCPLQPLNHIEEMFRLYKNTARLATFQDRLPIFVAALVAEVGADAGADAEAGKEQTFLQLINKRLHLNYYDTVRQRQVVRTRYKSVAHLMRCLLRTAHIPYIIDGKATRDGRYMDGMFPCIPLRKEILKKEKKDFEKKDFVKEKEKDFVKEKEKDFVKEKKEKDFVKEHLTLFVKLVTLQNVKRTFLVNQEHDLQYRLLAGVNDANEFFTTGSSDMCTYVEKWNVLQKVAADTRDFFLLKILGFLNFLYRYLPPNVKVKKLLRWMLQKLFSCNL